MFDDLLIHPRTRHQLEDFVKNPSHGLILTGPDGSGKKALAQAMAATILGIELSKLPQYPYYSLTDPTEQTITIDEIRALQKLLNLKTPATDGHLTRRVLLIIDAGRMKSEAQNAFLKSLEEPPADTCIILTAEANGGLLETIYSRVQRIDVLPVSEAMAKEYYLKKGVSSLEIAKNYALAQGQVGLLDSLLHTDASHPLKTWVDTGKQILAKPAGVRLLRTDELSKDKQEVYLLINALGRIVHAALVSASKAGSITAVKRWQTSLTAIQEARRGMEHNANLKLLLDHLLLSL